MPYSKAHYYLLGILIITVIAFWDGYFGQLQKAPSAHHLHGISSTLWIILMAFQGWVIHQKKPKLHRFVGKFLFILVPLMIGSFAMVTWVGAQKTVAGHPFYAQFGQALLTVDVLYTFAIALHVYLALKFRANIRLHSALFFGTIGGLLPPVLSRLFPLFIPGMEIDGLDTLYRFGYSLNLSVIVTLVFALILFKVYSKDGWPWLLTAVLVVLMYLLYSTLGQSEFWAQRVIELSQLQPWFVFAFGFVLGLLACFTGWIKGKSKT